MLLLKASGTLAPASWSLLGMDSLQSGQAGAERVSVDRSTRPSRGRKRFMVIPSSSAPSSTGRHREGGGQVVQHPVDDNAGDRDVKPNPESWAGDPSMGGPGAAVGQDEDGHDQRDNDRGQDCVGGKDREVDGPPGAGGE